MRAIGTGKRGGAHPGHHGGFVTGLGCAWHKQIGTPTYKRFVAKRHMVKRRLAGVAKRDYRTVSDAVGKRYGYTLYLVHGKRVLDINVDKTTVRVYIDNEHGEYRHNWPDVAIRLIRRVK